MYILKLSIAPGWTIESFFPGIHPPVIPIVVGKSLFSLTKALKISYVFQQLFLVYHNVSKKSTFLQNHPCCFLKFQKGSSQTTALPKIIQKLDWYNNYLVRKENLINLLNKNWKSINRIKHSYKSELQENGVMINLNSGSNTFFMITSAKEKTENYTIVKQMVIKLISQFLKK